MAVRYRRIGVIREGKLPADRRVPQSIPTLIEIDNATPSEFWRRVDQGFRTLD